MTINIANAPCSWGVDYADDINNPDWKNVFKQIAEAGYSYCEIGPYGFLPKDFQETQNFLNDFDLNVVGGFIFDHLHQSNKHSIIKSKIISTCSFLKKLNGKVFVIIDHISKERMKTSGKREISQDLPEDEYKALVSFLSEICIIVKEEYNLIHKEVASRILSTNEEKWNTIPRTYSEIDTLRNKFKQDDNKLKALDDINLYIEEMEKIYQKAS